MNEDTIMSMIDSSQVMDIHEHFSLPDQIINSPNPLLEILQRSYIGYHDFFPGLSPQFTQFTPYDGFPSSEFKDIKKFIQNFTMNDFLPSFEKGINIIHKIPLKPFTREIFNQLNDAIVENYSRKTIFKEFLYQFNIRKCILDIPHSNVGLKRKKGSFKDERFESALRINSLLFGFDPKAWNPQTALMKIATDEWHIFDEYASSLPEYLDNIEKILNEVNKKYIVFKCASAYERNINFGNRDDVLPGSHKWEVANNIFGKNFNECSEKERNFFGDVIIHYILDHAADLHIPFQCHTGTAIMEGSHPNGLIPAIESHPEVQFGLLHCGYPWIDDTIKILEAHENVHAEMVWIPMLSLDHAISFLKKIIEHQLTSRVIGFGGDTACIEGSAGALADRKSVV